MSHEVEQMFSVIETPWHRLGSILIEAPTFQEAMALGGLDWEVELRPVYVGAKPAEATAEDKAEVYNPRLTNLARAVVRLTDQRELGIVGPSYHPLQNKDAFGVLEPMVDQGFAKIETGGVLRNGQDVWMLVRFDVEALVAQMWEQTDLLEKDKASEKLVAAMVDEIAPYGLITNNHNGRRKVVIKETPVRVVCSNTLEMSLSADSDLTIEVVHTKNVKENVTSATGMLFGNIAKRYASVAVKRDALKRTELSKTEFTRAVLDVAAPISHLEKKVSRREDSGSTRASLERKHATRNRITKLWTEGDGHEADHSAWEAFNGLAQALDHGADFEMKNGPDSRVASLYDGTLLRIKQRAFRRLYKLADATKTERKAIAKAWK